MPEKYKVILTPRALSDLKQIIEHIEQESPANASSFVSRLIDAIDRLEQFPQRYRVYRGKQKLSASVRRMPFSRYLVYYAIRDSGPTVDVLTIRHGARRPPRGI